jgi:outer membrane protein assembly factor BamB
MWGLIGDRRYRVGVAKGRAIGRFEAFLGIVGILALVVTYALITGWNPLPGVTNWWNKAVNNTRTLSQPEPAWHVQTGDQPNGAFAVGSTVVVTSRGDVTGYSAGAGQKLWTKTVPWAGVAGDGSSAVVIAGRDKHGYDAVDPGTGAVRWSDDDAIGVWTYTDLVVGIACPDAMTCTLTARSPSSGTVRWHADLTGNGRTLAGVNKPISGVRPLTKLPDAPGAAPPLLGFLLNDQVQVVSTSTGKRLHTYKATQTTRVVVVGNRVVVVTVLWRDGNCRYAVDGRNPDGDRKVWHLDGYDLQTSSGLGCDQRRDPIGGDGLLAGVSPDNRDVLIDASTGSVAFKAAAGDTVAGTDGRMVLVRSADKRTVRALGLSGGTLWNRTAGKSADLGLAGGAAVFSDPGSNQLAAVGAQSGQVLLDAKSGATVLGYATNGLIINIGRQVGLVTYSGTAG